MQLNTRNKNQWSPAWYLRSLGVASVLAVVPGCGQASGEANQQVAVPVSQAAPRPVEPAGQNSPNQAATVLTRVPANLVCMVNNKYFGKQQIPVTFENRIYYGCCAMCEKKLRGNHQSRTAVDPVSGRSVDKAVAVIGARANDSVYYFENEENLKLFRVPSGS